MDFGTDFCNFAFYQTNKFYDLKFTRKFTNWYPRANISYQFTQRRRISFSYNGETQQPGINQIQPVLTNTNPLNILIGNPSLRPAFQNNMELRFSDYQVLKDQFIYAGAHST